MNLSRLLVKHLVKLRTEPSYRRAQAHVLITGNNLIQELCTTRPVKTLLVEETYDPPFLLSADVTYRVPAALLKKITGLEHPQPLAAEVALPPPGDLSKTRFLLILDGLADPGNLGTLLRTALALSWEGAFILSGSADPFNDKALRAAKGATFRLPLKVGTWDELSSLLAQNQMQTYVADLQGPPLLTQHPSAPLALILGNEARGVSAEAKKHAKPLTIPMSPHMESLNVASAGAILLHHLHPGHNAS